MKPEISPQSWFRFGNVINTTDQIAIYCIELSTFPETHMLTKFKCESFSEIPKLIKNLGWKYERVVEMTKKSGSITRVETENYIVFLDETRRAIAPLPEDFIDNAPEGIIEEQIPWPVIRSEYSDVYKYLNSKRLKPCPKYREECYCGKCWWTGISIVPECIPECTMCKNDTQKVAIKVNMGIKKVDIESDCCRSCIWWGWFHQIRKNAVGCKCDDICDCGKLNYRKKLTIIAQMEKLEIRHK